MGAKVPTVIYYDDELSIRAIGAETALSEVLVDAEEKGWTKAEQ